ncbi:putative flavin-containing amine oxidase [Gordonia hirsuta DSM 44140 = NBRC 16056]|uniref:Putative flavin-containing amine oxidase n=1 Tax=Gordonia hirsuta DSM 44140 = NBRC 16056 TaxID=1121927 RepID=L7L4J2_9ACTN|nr:putative flavin-containing amine oxidase [Gordonia hirsuta DSM 44140 = NBRC 16056]
MVVVGAGIAGLVAARRLTQRGIDTVVVEARDGVGGRLQNGELFDDVPIDVGGQWVGPGQHRVLALLSELGLQTFPTHVAGRHLAEIGGKRVTYTGRIPRLSPRILADLGQAQWRLDRTARRIAERTDPWRDREAQHLDGQTFASWVQRTARTADGRAFFRLATQALFSAEPEDLSALWALHYIGAGGGLDSLIETDGGAQQDRVVGGTVRIAEELAAQLGPRVVLGSPVTDIAWDPAAGPAEPTGVTVSGPGTRVHAERAVIALAPTLAGRLRYSPLLPTDRDQLTQRMPMGRVIKINVAYSEPFWRTAGFSGQANSDTRPMGTVFDNCLPGDDRGVLVGFLEGRHADAAARMEPEQRRRAVLDDLAGYFGEQARAPLAYLEKDWAAEEFSRGCYGAFGTPGTLTRFGPALRAAVGPLHWAGTETARRFPGYIDGAVESGERAAEEITAALG